MKVDKSAEQFIKLLEIVEKLRGPDGCPWDKEQTPASLLPYFLEETYEVIESIDQSNWDNLKEELGDNAMLPYKPRYQRRRKIHYI